MEPFLGEIRIFGGNFAPRGWALCDGQFLPINQNQALFSLLGTMYGGDGRTTFALPDLRGRAAMHMGEGPGLSARPQGQRGGAEQVTLTVQQIPSHRHGLPISDAPSQGAPQGAAAATTRGEGYAPMGQPISMGAALDAQGGGLGHENMGPYLTLNYIIALQGIFPPRS
ncbi:tail fiber protein [Myxococcota bacterium]|nr:tail fiber protein [Myxococcota bacterium]MBU1431759.1 tail fiber protein [Myxococcota bacterium]MBU1897454.1 tail fiber protein [Myxococcota bacterium]